MKLYDKVLPGTFLRRPNRFIAHVQTENGVEICHVKNTGRCAEQVTRFVAKIRPLLEGVRETTAEINL